MGNVKKGVKNITLVDYLNPKISQRSKKNCQIDRHRMSSPAECFNIGLGGVELAVTSKTKRLAVSLIENKSDCVER